jgi:ribulose-phosphate 3-epimerase
MTVDPGFGGQDFIPSAISKIRRIRALLDRVRPECELEVDGGIHPATAPLAVDAGARVLVAGSAVFEDPAGVRAAMARLQASIAGCRESLVGG